MSSISQKEKDTALLNACKSIEENLAEVQHLIESDANVNAVMGASRTLRLGRRAAVCLKFNL